MPKPGEEEAKKKAEEKAAQAAEEKARQAEAAKAAAEAAAAAPAASSSAGASKDGGSAAAAAAPAAGGGSSAGSKQKEPPAAAPAPPRIKRPRVENTEGLDTSWGEAAPPPIGIHPQPLLPMHLVAGTGDPGFVDGHIGRAMFRGPAGIAMGAAGCIVVCDADNRRVRKIVRKPTPPPSLGAMAAEMAAGGAPGSAESKVVFESVCTIAGCSQAGNREGRAKDATMCDPCGVAVDAQGNVLVSDSGTHTIRRVTPEGQVQVVAGCGKPGYQDGNGYQVAFDYP